MRVAWEPSPPFYTVPQNGADDCVRGGFCYPQALANAASRAPFSFCLKGLVEVKHDSRVDDKSAGDDRPILKKDAFHE